MPMPLRYRVQRIALLCAAALALLGSYAAIHHPCPAAQGTSLLGPAASAPESSTLKVASFNIHGEPLVCSPGDAVDVFLRSGADALAIGPFLVTRPA